MKVSRLVYVLALLVLLVSVVPAVGAAPSEKAYLVGSAAPLTADQVEQLKAAGMNVKYVYKNFGGASGTMPEKKAGTVRALPFVTSVNEDTPKQLDSVTFAPAQTSSLPNTPYWLDLMNAENNNTYTGDGVWVAVLDSGFYPNWRDYFNEDSILEEYGAAFIGPMGTDNDTWDSGSDPHGMAVAGTVIGFRFVDDANEGGWGEGYATGAAGEYYVPGVAPDAQIIPVKVCAPLGCYGGAINAGIDHITSIKLANPSQPIVINESLGGSGLDPVEKAAIDAAIGAGVVLVASAGNSGNGGMGFPAAYEPVISVAAGGWRDQWNNYPDKTWWLDDVPENGVDEVFITDFSSRSLNPGQYLDVAAPGRFMLLPYPCTALYKDGQVVSRTLHKTCASKATPDNASSANFQYLFMSGTSFSSPAVAGVVALMLEKNGALSNANAAFGTLGNPASWGPGSFETLLEGSATDIPADSVTVTHRTGVPDPECWEMGTAGCILEATGYGWVFIDDALAAVP
jgi:subtilisin family serine protease